MTSTGELKAFARKASGLTRVVSAKDALTYNINSTGMAYALVYASFGAGIYLGLDLAGSILPVLLLNIPIALLYAYFSIAMPRTGGDYVWVSRSIHPVLGFMGTFMLSVVLISWAASCPAWTLQWGIAPILRGLSVVYNDPGLITLADQISSPIAVQVYGLISFIAVAFVIARGIKFVIKTQWVMFVIILVGLTAFIATVVQAGPATFQQRFDSMSGTTMKQVISSAVSEGFWSEVTVSGIFLGMVYSFLNTVGFNFSVYYAGEVKDVRRTQFISIVGAIALFCFIMWAIYSTIYYGFGREFWHALSYIFNTGSASYTLPYPAFPQFLIIYFTTNPVVITLVGLSFALSAVVVQIVNPFIVTRSIFAWSFDRVVPTKLAELDRRYNSPYIALILVIILLMICQALWLYTNWLGYLSYGITGLFISVAIAGLAGVIFPYRRKAIFEASPAIVKGKIGSVPVISILGALTFIIAVFVIYATLMPAYIGTINPGYLAVLFLTYIVAIVIYAASAAYHRKRIPLELTFKEIPPE